MHKLKLSRDGLFWLAAFAYALAMGLILQKLVLPMMPSMHAGHGLLNDDASFFHSVAWDMAQRIRADGWGAWKLLSSGSATGNVGLLAAVYVFAGPEPAWFLPINAAFHALGATLLLKLGTELMGRKPALFAAFLFLVFPSSLVWYGQNHKDAFLISGFLLVLLAFVRGLRGGDTAFWRNGLMLGVGIFLVAIMRSHMVAVYALAMGCALAFMVFLQLLWPKVDGWGGIRRGLGLLLLALLAAVLAPKNNELISTDLVQISSKARASADEMKALAAEARAKALAAEARAKALAAEASALAAEARASGDEASALAAEARVLAAEAEARALAAEAEARALAAETGVDTGIDLGIWEWQPLEALPTKVDGALKQISSLRVHFIESGRRVGASSVVDGDRKPENALEVLAYLPRAAVVGVFAPFPSFWGERLSLPRVIGSLETLILYLVCPGIFFALFKGRSREVIACLVVAAAVVTVLSYVGPNLGTLHRVRYGQFFIFLLAGAYGWGLILSQLMHRVGPRASAQGGSEAANVGAGAAPSARRAASAGLVVTLVSMLGLLGLLIRDLMLIEKVGLGAQLDDYYLALMIPMFFIGVLAIPIGDALTPALVRAQHSPQFRRLVGGSVTLATGLTIAVCAALLLFAEQILAAFSAQSEIHTLLRLFWIAMPLLACSGAIIVGNSLLNAVGRPVVAAVAQLIVPAAVIAAILLATEDQVVTAAMLGMVLGQLGNLLILWGILLRSGFSLRPVGVQAVMGDPTILSGYRWLVVCALLTGLAVPVNYWFAGTAGVGAVSTWALGSKLVQIATVVGTSLLTAVFVPYLSQLVASGLHARVRGDLFLSLVVGSWGGAVPLLAVFIFVEPIVFAVMSAEQEAAAYQLCSLIKLGALQLPFVICSTLLIKLCAVSSVSRKAVIAAAIGLVSNIAMNLVLMPYWGLLGVACAWTFSSLIAALVIMQTTRRQSQLMAVEVGLVIATWVLLFAMGAALHMMNLALGIAVVLLAVALGYAQLHWFGRKNHEATLVSGTLAG